jgi:16S rRNA (cytidine1402-2'-O)-methyltransferase
MKSNIGAGCLYVVATPIGNLQDLGRRAEEVLRQVDGVVCENTRNSQKLLQHYGIATPCVGKITDHQGGREVQKLVDKMLLGAELAYISDAGTPGVSDPGMTLVACAHAGGVRVVPVPGPSAVTTALSAVGFVATPWAFLGFFPEKSGPRKAEAQAVQERACATVFFESPHRVEKTVQALHACLAPTRRVGIVREVTKLYEQVWVGKARDLGVLGEEVPVKGEFTIVVEGAGKEVPVKGEGLPDLAGHKLMQAMIKHGMTGKQIVAVIQEAGGGSKNQIYQSYLAMIASEE